MSEPLTDLTAATTWSGTDLFYAVVSGNSRKIEAANLLVKEVANTLSQVNGTSTQTFRLYRTFTDSSNYERLAIQTTTGVIELAAETAGTGQDNISIKLTPVGTGWVEIGATGGSGNAPLTVLTSKAASNTEGLFILAANLTSGQYLYNSIGKSASTGNSFGLRFKYVGDNDATNEFNIEFYGGSQPIVAYNSGAVQLFKHLSTPAGGSTAARLLFGSSSGLGIYIGSGAPTVSASKGSLYLRSDGTTTNDRLYINNSGTTWIAITTAS